MTDHIDVALSEQLTEALFGMVTHSLDEDVPVSATFLCDGEASGWEELLTLVQDAGHPFEPAPEAETHPDVLLAVRVLTDAGEPAGGIVVRRQAPSGHVAFRGIY